MSDPDSFPTLQSIVLHEVQADVTQVRNSATEALLWLRRGLKFLKEFLSEINAGEQDIQSALSEFVLNDTKSNMYQLIKTHHVFYLMICLFFHSDNAYGKTLRQYHGWVVRGVFAVGVPHINHWFLICVFLSSQSLIHALCDHFVFLLQLALRAAPSYQNFAAALVSREGDELKSGFTSGVHRDLGVYLPAMEKQLAILDALYEEYNLESDEVV